MAEAEDLIKESRDLAFLIEREVDNEDCDFDFVDHDMVAFIRRLSDALEAKDREIASLTKDGAAKDERITWLESEQAFFIAELTRLLEKLGKKDLAE